MPTLEATTTTQTQVKIKPTVLQKLRRELKLFAELRLQLKTLEHAMDKHKGIIAEIREESGEQSIMLDGFTITLVAPVRKVFDAKRYVTLGGDLAIYNAANVETPSKPYTKVTTPKDDDE